MKRLTQEDINSAVISDITSETKIHMWFNRSVIYYAEFEYLASEQAFALSTKLIFVFPRFYRGKDFRQLFFRSPDREDAQGNMVYDLKDYSGAFTEHIDESHDLEARIHSMVSNLSVRFVEQSLDTNTITRYLVEVLNKPMPKSFFRHLVISKHRVVLFAEAQIPRFRCNAVGDWMLWYERPLWKNPFGVMPKEFYRGFTGELGYAFASRRSSIGWMALFLMVISNQEVIEDARDAISSAKYPTYY